jgi:hypothetical protein
MGIVVLKEINTILNPNANVAKDIKNPNNYLKTYM